MGGTHMLNEVFVNHFPYSPPKYLFKFVYSDSENFYMVIIHLLKISSFLSN